MLSFTFTAEKKCEKEKNDTRTQPQMIKRHTWLTHHQQMRITKVIIKVN